MKPLANFLSSSYSQMPPITWHLLVNRTIQRNNTSCSAASLCIALNGLISLGLPELLEKPLEEPQVLDMLPESNLRRNLSEGKGGATLDQITEMASQALEALGVSSFTVTRNYLDEPNGRYLENFRKDLAYSAENRNSVIIANYHQGVATGKDYTHGHHAPVAPIDSNLLQLCVVDPSMDRSPFIIDTDHLCRAMATRDNTAGFNRGYTKIVIEGI